MTEEKYSTLLGQVQECFKELELPLMETREVDGSESYPDRLVFHSWMKNGPEIYRITAIIVNGQDLVFLSISNRERIPEEKWPSLWRLFKFLNGIHPFGHWVLDPLSENVEFRSAVLVAESGFNQEQFRTVLRRSLDNSNRHSPLIQKMIETGGDPLDLLRDFKVYRYRT